MKHTNCLVFAIRIASCTERNAGRANEQVHEYLSAKKTLPLNVSGGVGLPTETQVKFVLKLTSSTAMLEANVTPATPSIITWSE